MKIKSQLCVWSNSGKNVCYLNLWYFLSNFCASEAWKVSINRSNSALNTSLSQGWVLWCEKLWCGQIAKFTSSQGSVNLILTHLNFYFDCLFFSKPFSIYHQFTTLIPIKEHSKRESWILLLFYLALNLNFIATVNLPVKCALKGPKIAPLHFICCVSFCLMEISSLK